MDFLKKLFCFHSYKESKKCSECGKLNYHDFRGLWACHGCGNNGHSLTISCVKCNKIICV